MCSHCCPLVDSLLRSTSTRDAGVVMTSCWRLHARGMRRAAREPNGSPRSGSARWIDVPARGPGGLGCRGGDARHAKPCIAGQSAAARRPALRSMPVRVRRPGDGSSRSAHCSRVGARAGPGCSCRCARGILRDGVESCRRMRVEFSRLAGSSGGLQYSFRVTHDGRELRRPCAVIDLEWSASAGTAQRDGIEAGPAPRKAAGRTPCFPRPCALSRALAGDRTGLVRQATCSSATWIRRGTADRGARRGRGRGWSEGGAAAGSASSEEEHGLCCDSTAQGLEQAGDESIARDDDVGRARGCGGNAQVSGGCFVTDCGKRPRG